MLYVSCFFFFKQKTAYEMRISDWSSDVCAEDLRCPAAQRVRRQAQLDFVPQRQQFRRHLAFRPGGDNVPYRREEMLLEGSTQLLDTNSFGAWIFPLLEPQGDAPRDRKSVG